MDEEPTKRQAKAGRQLGESTNSRGKWQQSDEWGAKRSQETVSEESNGWEPSSFDAAQNRQANVGKQVGSQLGRQMSRKLWHHHHHYLHQHNHHNHSKPLKMIENGEQEQETKITQTLTPPTGRQMQLMQSQSGNWKSPKSPQATTQTGAKCKNKNQTWGAKDTE